MDAGLEVEMWEVEELVIEQKHTVKFLRKVTSINNHPLARSIYFFKESLFL